VNVLTVNAGSSSVKLSVIGPDDATLCARDRSGTGAFPGDLLTACIEDAPSVDAVAVRLVHGGDVVRGPALVDARLRDQLAELATLAPLHDPLALDAIDEVMRVLPSVPVVACVDTAFHATIAAAAATYAIPWEWTHDHGIRKYGFHGFSHRYASRRAAELLARPIEDMRTVTCHLGAGASLAAVVGGASVDTTMGFTPLDGLVMATRSGSVDPGVVTWMQRRTNASAAEIEAQLSRSSGLLGISGSSGDLREVERLAASGDARAQLAIDVMTHRVVTAIGAMIVAAGGVDALVFTGGIGEGSAALRRAVAERLQFLGMKVGAANEQVDNADIEVSPPGAAIAVLVVHAREDVELARDARQLLGQ